ncbi:hypothetical protein LguiB_036013 [Lonicera macranthoides]
MGFRAIHHVEKDQLPSSLMDCFLSVACSLSTDALPCERKHHISWANKAMSIVASDYDFGYDDKALFEKTYCYSAYEAFGVPSPLTEVETTEDCETRSYVGFSVYCLQWLTFNEAIRDDLEIEVLRAEPHTLDQAIATAHKQEKINVKLGLNTFKGCKLPNPSQNTTSKNLVNLVNLTIATGGGLREGSIRCIGLGLGTCNSGRFGDVTLIAMSAPPHHFEMAYSSGETNYRVTINHDYWARRFGLDDLSESAGSCFSSYRVERESEGFRGRWGRDDRPSYESYE